MSNRSYSKNQSPTHILLFDGVCNLCNTMVRFTIRRDHKGKFKFAALQSEPGKELLNKFGLEDSQLESFVFISEDKCYLKSSAGLHVLKELGGVWKLTYIFIYIPGPLRDFVYDLIAKTRYKVFGKRDTCMIPSMEIKDRFL